MLLSAAALAFTATAAFAQVTPNPTLTGTTVSMIPAITLTSDLGAGTAIDWEISGPNNVSIDGSGPSSPLTLPAQVPPGLDGLYTLSAGENGGARAAIGTFTVDRTPPAVPMVTSGPPAITGARAPFTFVWTTQPTATSSHWHLLDGITQIAAGDTANTQVAIPPPALAPGDRILSFRVSLLDNVLNPSPFSAPYVFNVDQTPPGVPVLVTAPPVLTRNRTPTFAWQGTELGGTFEWDITDASGKTIFTPGSVRTTTDTKLSTLSLPLVSNVTYKLTFRVRQVDPFGNRGADRIFGFTLVPPLVPPPPTRSAKYMSPKAGSGGIGLQPLLSWRRIHGGTTIFNVKVFRGGREILSAFPRRNRYRVPKGKLRRGVQYKWFVFSYIGKRKTYVAKPMASYFTTKP